MTAFKGGKTVRQHLASEIQAKALSNEELTGCEEQTTFEACYARVLAKVLTGEAREAKPPTETAKTRTRQSFRFQQIIVMQFMLLFQRIQMRHLSEKHVRNTTTLKHANPVILQNLQMSSLSNCPFFKTNLSEACGRQSKAGVLLCVRGEAAHVTCFKVRYCSRRFFVLVPIVRDHTPRTTDEQKETMG